MSGRDPFRRRFRRRLEYRRAGLRRPLGVAPGVYSLRPEKIEVLARRRAAGRRPARRRRAPSPTCSTRAPSAGSRSRSARLTLNAAVAATGGEAVAGQPVRVAFARAALHRMEDAVTAAALAPLPRLATASSAASPMCSMRRPRLFLLLLLGAAAALDRRRLCRLARRAARPELLLDRRVLRADQPRIHAEDLWRASPSRQSRHHHPLGADGGGGDADLRRRSPSPSPITPRATPAAAWKALFYIAVTLPLWSSYLVRVYAWKLILAKEGILNWVVERTGLTPLLDLVLACR